MKKLLLIVSYVSMVLTAQSQNLTVEGAAPNLYITHTVAPKENFYSVGRLYNQSARSIATFNNIVMEKGLTIGQRVKIPLNDQNLDVSGNAGSSTIPLTHVVVKGESLSKIGSDHNVSAALLKQWNNISSDNIAPGTPVVVGHLRMQATTSTASQPPANNRQVEIQPITTTSNAVKTPAPAVAEPKNETVSAVTAPAPTNAQKEVANQSNRSVNSSVKEIEPKANEPVKHNAYSYSSVSNGSSVEGVFAGIFPTEEAQKAINNKSGEAATFKSTSGWQDKKYYVLMNDVEPGTIVKIASMENKVVYAKVLGSMPEMKENNGLLIRISNAAASYLGIIDPKFPVQISYYQ